MTVGMEGKICGLIPDIFERKINLSYAVLTVPRVNLMKILSGNMTMIVI